MANRQHKKTNVITSDGEQFQVQEFLLIKHSLFIKGILEDEKGQQDLKLLETDSPSFKQILHFMQMHRDQAPAPIKYPLKKNSRLNAIMAEEDANFVASLLQKNDNLDLFKKVLNSSAYLQMEDLKKILMTGLTIKLLKQPICEKDQVSTVEMREQCFQKLHMQNQSKKQE